jgi:Family of unknown function (DUF5994)
VNGLTGTRRLARPVRLALARQLGADIDGAWWPHTGLVAHELPELIEALHPPLGEVVDICINWSAAEAAVDLSSLVNGARWQRGERRRRFRLMMVAGRQVSAKLLVVPHMTPQALGIMVMRCAAARSIPDSDRETDVFKIADSAVRAAQDESAFWTSRTHGVSVIESVVEIPPGASG